MHLSTATKVLALTYHRALCWSIRFHVTPTKKAHQKEPGLYILLYQLGSSLFSGIFLQWQSGVYKNISNIRDDSDC